MKSSARIGTSFVIALGMSAWLGAQFAAGQARESARDLQVPQGERDELSTVIYPSQRIALRMDHALEAHRRLRCARCHQRAGRSRTTRDLLLPSESSCRPCHDEALDRDQGDADRCSLCHMGAARSDEPIASTQMPPARLRFSHRAHVARGDRCLDCHRSVDASHLGERSHLPSMEQCIDCHEARGASVDCSTCHLTLPDGRLRTRFENGRLRPQGADASIAHDAEWLVRHRWVAADEGTLCAQCHVESDCSDCHDGRVRPQRVHPGGYLSAHAVEARRQMPRCTSCHQVARFCTECHSRIGMAPISAPDVRRAGRMHPPQAIWLDGPNLHALEARRSLSTCASCHAERDCVQCHGSLGIGAGVSPHPPGFARECRSALAGNTRACITCHGDLDALAARCL